MYQPMYPQPQPQPVSYDDFSSTEFGLIAPNGKLFSCGFTGHSDLAYKLSQAGVVTKNPNATHHGCVHIAEYEFDFIELSGRSQYHKDALRVTQRQLDTMADYMTANGRSFDFSVLEVI